MTVRNWLTPLLLGACVTISALVVVKTKHENRTLVHELEQLRAEKARLETEWAQLQLEEATLAQHGRVEQIARDKLGMTEPPNVEVVGQQERPRHGAASEASAGAGVAAARRPQAGSDSLMPAEARR